MLALLDNCCKQPINQTVFDARDSPSRLTIVRSAKVGLTCRSGEIQFGHSPLGPASACIQCTVRSFARRHGLVETGSVRSLRLPRGTCARNFGANRVGPACRSQHASRSFSQRTRRRSASRRHPTIRHSSGWLETAYLPNAGRGAPTVDCALDPVGHGHCAHMAGFTYQVDNRPMSVPSLNLSDL